jgi:hypothetical protein
MEKEKQIEEMARDICHSRTCKIRKNGGSCYKYCNAYIYAFRAYNAGYRKESEVEKAKQEVAREIFEEIEQKCLFEEIVGCSEAKLLDEEAYSELKKKRIGE